MPVPALPLRLLCALAMLSTLMLPARAAPTPLDQALAATYVVRSDDAADRFLGSAFRWRDGQVAVTNAHVVGEATTVTLLDAAGARRQARVIARDPVRDVAVLSLPGPAVPGLDPGPPAQVGAEVWAIGAPLGADFSVTSGTVSAQARQVEPAVPLRLLQHDAAVNPGSSGGPLIDAQGRLVGMNSQIADGSRSFVGIAYAISAADLDRIVQGLVAETLPPVPHLGLLLRPVTGAAAAALALPQGGALVDRVEAGSPAATAGLRAGDVIAAAAGQPLADPGALAFAVDAAGDALPLTVLRGRQALTLTLQLVQTDTATLRDIADAQPRTASYTLKTLGIGIGPDAQVTTLTDQSPALFAGLAKGDRILSVNGTPATAASLTALAITAPVLLLVQRDGSGTRHLLLDPWDETATFRPVGGANVLDPEVVVF